MMDDHKTHDARNRSPHQIQDTITHGDIVFTVNRTGATGKGCIIHSEILQTNLLAIDSGLPLTAVFKDSYWHIGHSVALGARDQMMPIDQERCKPCARL